MTYVALDDDGAVVGFVTVASSSIETALLGKTGPASCPVLLLGRMAVSLPLQRRGIGGRLMRHVFELARDQHHATGCQAVIVDAKPGAITFYEQYQFVAMPSVTGTATRMSLEIGTVLAAIAGA